MNQLFILIGIPVVMIMLLFSTAIYVGLHAQEDKPDQRCLAYTDPDGHFAVVTVARMQDGYSYFCHGSHEAIQWFVVQHGYRIAAASSLEIYLVR